MAELRGTFVIPAGGIDCTCGHTIPEDGVCCCPDWCPTCVAVDCCAEAWGRAEAGLDPHGGDDD